MSRLGRRRIIGSDLGWQQEYRYKMINPYPRKDEPEMIITAADPLGARIRVLDAATRNVIPDIVRLNLLTGEFEQVRRDLNGRPVVEDQKIVVDKITNTKVIVEISPPIGMTDIYDVEAELL